MKGLEALYRKYYAQGFAVLGFPCNQFAAQEPGDAAELARLCSQSYNVTFLIFGKIDVARFAPAAAPKGLEKEIEKPLATRCVGARGV